MLRSVAVAVNMTVACRELWCVGGWKNVQRCRDGNSIAVLVST